MSVMVHTFDRVIFNEELLVDRPDLLTSAEIDAVNGGNPGDAAGAVAAGGAAVVGGLELAGAGYVITGAIVASGGGAAILFGGAALGYYAYQHFA